MIKVSFENTEIAFRAKSNKELKRAHRLFRLVGKPWLVRMGEFFTNLFIKIGLLPKGIIRKTIFAQFCGGESITDCEKRIKELAEYNVGTILDYSVEGKTELEDFETTCKEIIATIDKGNGNSSIPFSVFKVTGIARFGILEKANNPAANLSDAERRELADVHLRVDRICRRAYETGTPVFIDAEESWIQGTIDRMAEAMMARYNKEKAIVFNTVQIYRHDRFAYLKEMHKRATQGGYNMGVKLVRGAYMEKERERAKEKGYPSPIQPNKAATDRDYDKALVFCVKHINSIGLCAGTHNEASSMLLTQLVQENGLATNDTRIWFAQLLGMSDHISFNLAYHDFNVAKYVPYGPVKEVMPYLLRRAKENTSVAGQTGRELSLIIKEINRRKGKN